jgi:hypothetical protein
VRGKKSETKIEKKRQEKKKKKEGAEFGVLFCAVLVTLGW